MRGIFFAIPALLALADGAVAEPQRLDEAQLGDIAAGQDAGGWLTLLSQLASPTEGSSLSGQAGSSTLPPQQPASPGETMTSPSQSTVSQTLTSTSSNISHTESSGLPGVSANGWAASVTLGTIGGPPLGQ